MTDETHYDVEMGVRLLLIPVVIETPAIDRIRAEQEVTTNMYSWKPIGPAPEKSQLTGDVSGRVLAIAVSESHDGRGTPALYIGIDGGGLWRSTDFQSFAPEWRNLTDTADLAIRSHLLAIPAITVDPGRAQTLYMAPGDPAFEVLKSVDGGDTWTVQSAQFSGQWPIGKVVVDPTDVTGSTLFLYGGGAGVYKSGDGGRSWTAIVAGLPSNFRASGLDFTVDTDGQLTLYAAVGYSATDKLGVFKSDNAGTNWARVPIQLSDQAGGNVTDNDIGAISLVSDHKPGAAHGVFVAVANKGTSALMNVFKLVNGQFVPSGVGLRPVNVLSGQALGMGRDGSLYFGGVNDSRQNGLYQSTDNGRSWASIDVGSNGLRPHTDQHSWNFFNGAVYAGNDGGIWRFNPLPNKRSGPGSWESLNTSSLQTILAQGASMHPTDDTVCLCGSQDNAIALFSNGSWTETGGSDNSKVLFDPDSRDGGRHAYFTGVSDFHFFARSDDGGRSWNDKSPSDAQKQKASIDWYAPFAIHPIDTARIVVGIDRVYETRDRGDTWGSAVSPIFSTIQSSAIAFATNDIIWVAYDQKVYLTVNAGGDGSGANWKEVGRSTNFGGSIIKIVVDSRFPETIYLASRGGRVWKTPDSGTTWMDITGNLPAVTLNTMALVPGSGFDDPLLIVGGIVGAYLSFNQGATLSWGSLNDGLPYANIQDLEYRNLHATLVAAVYGRGVYTTSLASFRKPQLSIRVPTNECGTPAACGATVTLSFTLANEINAVSYKTIQWTVVNGNPAPGETSDQPTFRVVMPPTPEHVIVAVFISLEDGYLVATSTTLECVTATMAEWLDELCHLIHLVKVNLFVDPLWDPLRDFVTTPVTRQEVQSSKQSLQELATSIRQILKLDPMGGIRG